MAFAEFSILENPLFLGTLRTGIAVEEFEELLRTYNLLVHRGAA